MVQAIAVGTEDAVMGAMCVLAGGRVLNVVGGEVLARALVTLGRPCSADISGVAPLETSGALSGRGGYRPGQTPSHGAYECNGSP